MLRTFGLTVALVGVLAVSAEAQIISNPVVTSWPPYTTMTTYRLPAGPPIAAEVCTPPVVTFYAPAAPRPSCCSPVVAYRVPAVTTYYAPPVTSYRVVLSPTYVTPAAPVVVAPTTTYYQPMWNYRMPLAPTTTLYSSSPVVGTPVTSFYAPAAAAPAVSAPVAVGRSCGCGGH
jgi:hypothetical protein